MEAEFDEGSALFMDGKCEDALKILTEVYKKRKTIFGPDHPKTTKVLLTIAVVFFKQGNLEKSMQVYKKCLTKSNRSLGYNHPITLTIQHCIAFLHGQQEEYDEAIEIFKDVYAKRRTLLGATHPDTLCTRYNLSFLLSKHKGKNVVPVFEEIYNIMKRKFPDNPNTLLVQRNIDFLAKQSKCDAAIESPNAAIESILQKNENLPKKNDPDALTTLEVIADVNTEEGNIHVLDTQRRSTDEKRNIGQ